MTGLAPIPPPPPLPVYEPPPVPPHPPPPQQRTVSLAPPRPNLLDEDATVEDPPPPPAQLAPPRPPNPELLQLHARVHEKLRTELASVSQAMTLDGERLRAQQADLLTGVPAIRDEMGRLEAVRDVCRGVATRLRGAVEQAERGVSELKRKGDPPVDELVCSTSIVHNQCVSRNIVLAIRSHNLPLADLSSSSPKTTRLRTRYITSTARSMLDGSILTGSYAFVSWFVHHCSRANNTYHELTDDSGTGRRAIHEARAHRAHPDFPSDGRIRSSGMGLSWIRARRYRLISVNHVTRTYCST